MSGAFHDAEPWARTRTRTCLPVAAYRRMLPSYRGQTALGSHEPAKRSRRRRSGSRQPHRSWHAWNAGHLGLSLRGGLGALADGDVEEVTVAVAAEPVGLVDAGSAVARIHGGVDDGGLSLGAAAVADAHLGVAAHELKVHAPAVAVEAAGVHALDGDGAAAAFTPTGAGAGSGAGPGTRRR